MIEEILIGTVVVCTILIALGLIHIVHTTRQWKKEDKNPCIECPKEYSDCKYCKYFDKYGGKLRW